MNRNNILLVYTLCIAQLALVGNGIYAQSGGGTNSSTPITIEQIDASRDSLIRAVRASNFEKVIESAPIIVKQAKQIEYELGVSQAKNILGQAFYYIDDRERASQIFKEVLDQAQKANDTALILKSYINLGNVAIVPDPEMAISYFQDGLRLSKMQKTSNLTSFLSFIFHNNLSELYVGTQDVQRAQYHSDKALEYLKMGVMEGRDNEGLATIYFVRGNIYLQEKKYSKAIEAIKKSLDLGTNVLDADYLIGNYKNLIDIYDKTNQLEKLNVVRKVYDSLRDSRYEDEKVRQQQVARTKYNIGKYEQELRASQLENKIAEQQSSKDRLLLITSLIIALALLILIGLLLYGRNKRSILLKTLRVKNRQYLAAKERSEKLAQSKTAFLSTISHELRTPLYGIIGLTSVFLKDPKLVSHKDDLQSLKFSADYLLALVNDVLRLNKLSSNKGREIQKHQFHIRKLIAGVVQTFEFINKKNNNQVTVSIDPEVPKVIVGDKIKIAQVLMNLVSNASKFTEDGSIEVIVNLKSVQNTSCDIYFNIIDTGGGIPEEQQKKIFDEFAQVNTLNDKGGTGLGLPIVNKILKILGGKLKFKSTYGEGTQFCFILKFGVGDQEFQELSEINSDEELLKNKSVLIVDDNKINQIVSQKVLDMLHINHHTASNGLEALEKVKENTFDVILMDINMPVMGGKETSKEIRNLNIHTPIIALTATDYEDVENELYIHGINDNIVKPYNNDQLVSLLLKYIS